MTTSLAFESRDESLETDGREQAWTGGRAIETNVKVFGNFPAFRMLSGIAIEVDREDDVAIMVGAHARNRGTAAGEDSREIGGTYYWVSTRRFHIADRDSLIRVLEELSFELLENLRPALEEFADEIARWRYNAGTARKFGY